MAEGNGLLNRHTPKGYRGFESLRLRQGLCGLLIFERALSQLNGDGCRFTTADA